MWTRRLDAAVSVLRQRLGRREVARDSSYGRVPMYRFLLPDTLNGMERFQILLVEALKA
jgi:hypothetical protein